MSWPLEESRGRAWPLPYCPLDGRQASSPRPFRGLVPTVRALSMLQVVVVDSAERFEAYNAAQLALACSGTVHMYMLYVLCMRSAPSTVHLVRTWCWHAVARFAPLWHRSVPHGLNTRAASLPR